MPKKSPPSAPKKTSSSPDSLKSLRETHYTLRMKHALRELKETHLLKKARRALARHLTKLHNS